MARTTPLNIAGVDFTQNAHAHLARLRQSSPVYRARMTRWQTIYLLTRYDDVASAFKDPRIVKNPANASDSAGMMPWMPATVRALMQNMLNSDEPDHRRLRNLVHKAFTPRRIMQLEPRIQAIADELLHKARKKGTVDLIADFGRPLPVTVIAELIGIPKQDHVTFTDWTAKIVVNPTPLNLIKAIPAIRKFTQYTRKLAAQRRADPQDDLITALAEAEDEGEKFSEEELVAMVFLLVLAGHETTIGLLTNGTATLLQHPEQLELLRSEPHRIDEAIEEMLRYDGPLVTTEPSYAAEEMTLHGITIPRGGLVLPAILSANRDERAFENAGTFDITRGRTKHLAFGHGIHYCLGAPLARLEAKIGFSSLLQQVPSLRLAASAETLKYKNTMLIHQLKSLPVQF